LLVEALYTRGSKPSRITGSGEAKKAAGGQNSYEFSAENVKEPSKQESIISTLLSIHCTDDSEEESQPMYIHAPKSSLSQHMSPSLPLCHHKHLHQVVFINHALSTGESRTIFHQQVMLVLHMLAFYLRNTTLASSSRLWNKTARSKQAYQRDAGI
jgi:hypothetical protein